MKNKKVVIGMSGGVDSSTSAYLLKRNGYEVIGVTLTFSPEKVEDEFRDARKICESLGIQYITVDISKEFNEIVIDDFLKEYSKGSTPSPCIICDEKIKFYFLFKLADQLGANFVATGHYAKVEKCPEFENILLLKMSINSQKDQNYMLYRLSTDKLERLIFPLYNIEKKEVRSIAKNIGLAVHDKKDSQGICFAKEGYIPFLKSHLGNEVRMGNFVLKSGEILGQHQGYQLYTIGQRRGFGIKLPRAYFITEIRPESNEIVLGEYDELFKKKIRLLDFISNVPMEKLLSVKLVGRPRFSSKGFEGKLIHEENEYYFEYNEKNPQNAPGQHLVLYYNGFVVGGGKISI